jgi:hypothetical protein
VGSGVFVLAAYPGEFLIRREEAEKMGLMLRAVPERSPYDRGLPFRRLVRLRPCGVSVAL